jgi:segregation and condensation protein B
VDQDQLKSVIEGLLFTSSDPVGVNTLASVVSGESRQRIQGILDELEDEYRRRSRGFVLVQVAGGYQFRTLPAIAPWLKDLNRLKPSRLSRAALETLAIVAYNQPITKASVEQIRGVESSGPIKSLIDRELIAILGRKDVPGRPLLYGTSRRFLEVFGLPGLEALPPLPDPETLSD